MRSETPHVNFLESHASSSIRVEAQPDTLQSARQFFETCRYLGGEDIQKVSDALYFAHVAHRYFSIDPKKATRKDGKSEYTTHLIAVAQILSEEKCDAVTLQSALLHDVLENTKVTEEYLGRTFGKEVLQTVKTVTKVEGSKADTELKILDGLKDDPRGILIKLADRLHNLRTISFLKENKQKEIALQTYEIYAPLARELGLHAWADELYDRSVEILWEDEYKLLSLKREKEFRKAYEAFSPFEEFLAKKYPDKMILSVSQPAIYSLIDFDESEKSQNTKILTPVEIITTDEEKEKLITFFKTFCAENDIVYDPQGNAEIKLNIGTASFLIRILDQQTASQYYASLLDLYREPSEISSAFKNQLELARFAKEKVDTLQVLYQQVSEENTLTGMVHKRGGLGILKNFKEAAKSRLMIVYVDGEKRIVPRGTTVLELAYSVSHAQGRILHDTKIQERDNVSFVTVLSPGDIVDFSPSAHKTKNEGENIHDPWSVDVSWLDFVKQERYKNAIRHDLSRILKTAEKYNKFESQLKKINTGEAQASDFSNKLYPSISSDVEVMGFTFDQLTKISQKIRSDAEKRGEKVLKQRYSQRYEQLYKDMHNGESPRKPYTSPHVEMERGWRLISPNKKKMFKQSYQQFMLNCGLGKVPEGFIDTFLRKVIEYEQRRIKRLSYILPDKQSVLARVLAVAGVFSNLVDVTISPNEENVKVGNLKVAIDIEIDKDTQEEIDSSFDDLVKIVNKAVDGYNHDNSNLQKPMDIILPLTARSPLFGYFAYFGMLGLTVESYKYDSQNKKALIRLVPLNPSDDQTQPEKMTEFYEVMQQIEVQLSMQESADKQL